MTDALDAALLNAHAQNDQNALIGLYERAARDAKTEDAAGFYLTHAYVFALECGDTRAESLRAQLVKMGRESGS